MQYDAIVLGVGSLGASACYHLASRGQKVLGLEQFTITHEEGSHSGQSRLIRKAYFEHPDYVPLLESAFEEWHRLEELTGEQLYWPTGIVYLGRPDDEILKGIRASSAQYGIPLLNKPLEEYPEFNIPEEFSCILEPEAGFVSPERTIETLVHLARKEGAEILENQKVTGWEQSGQEVIVTTETQEFKTKKLIISAGAFTNELVDLPLKMTRQYLGWTPTDAHKLGDFPCWVISDDRTGIFYGFPADTGLPGPEGLKIGYHRPGDKLDAPDRSDSERALLNGVLDQYFHASLQVDEMKTCKYTYSPDEHFILDFLPKTNNQVIIASGFSGHGFKFVPIMGEILADLAIHSTTKHPIDFLSLKRLDGGATD